MNLAYASPAQRFEAAFEAYRAGRPADAARLLDAVLQSDPRSAPALHLMGLCLGDLGDLAQAERALRASLASDKRRPAVHAALAKVLYASGRAAEAEKAYRVGLAMDRRNVAVVAGLADLLLVQARPKEALQLLVPLLAGTDVATPVLDLHTEALKQLGRLDEALEAARRSAAAGSGQGQIETAVMLREMGRYPEAEVEARKAVAMVGEHPAAMALLGYTLQDLNRLEESEAVYRQALTKAPFDPALHLALARHLWAKTGDPDKATIALDSVLRQKATSPLLAIRAKLHTRAGQPDRAYALLAEAVKNLPDDALLHAAAATAEATLAASSGKPSVAGSAGDPTRRSNQRRA